MIYQFIITFYKIVHLIWKVIYLYLNCGNSTIVISYFFLFLSGTYGPPSAHF